MPASFPKGLQLDSSSRRERLDSLKHQGAPKEPSGEPLEDMQKVRRSSKYHEKDSRASASHKNEELLIGITAEQLDLDLAFNS